VGKRIAWHNLLKDVETGKLEAISRLLQFDVWVREMIKKAKAN